MTPSALLHFSHSTRPVPSRGVQPPGNRLYVQLFSFAVCSEAGRRPCGEGVHRVSVFRIRYFGLRAPATTFRFRSSSERKVNLE
jgi:hypothetical protein